MPSYARLLAARVTDGLSGAVSNAPSLPATGEFQTLRGGGEPRRVAFSFSVAQCTEHARGTWQSGEFTIVLEFTIVREFTRRLRTSREWVLVVPNEHSER